MRIDDPTRTSTLPIHYRGSLGRPPGFPACSLAYGTNHSDLSRSLAARTYIVTVVLPLTKITIACIDVASPVVNVASLC